MRAQVRARPQEEVSLAEVRRLWTPGERKAPRAPGNGRMSPRRRVVISSELGADGRAAGRTGAGPPRRRGQEGRAGPGAVRGQAMQLGNIADESRFQACPGRGFRRVEWPGAGDEGDGGVVAGRERGRRALLDLAAAAGARQRKQPQHGQQQRERREDRPRARDRGFHELASYRRRRAVRIKKVSRPSCACSRARRAPRWRARASPVSGPNRAGPRNRGAAPRRRCPPLPRSRRWPRARRWSSSCTAALGAPRRRRARRRGPRRRPRPRCSGSPRHRSRSALRRAGTLSADRCTRSRGARSLAWPRAYASERQAPASTASGLAVQTWSCA